MSQNLKDKYALVTGGSRGIGAAIAKRLAREGAHVALTYTGSAARAEEVVREIEKLGVKSLAFQADSADAEAVVSVVNRTASELGGLNILVNNAGVFVVGPLDDFKLADFDRTVAVNIRAVFVAIQAAAKHMKDGGRIINIGSCNAERMPFPNGGVYAMSKAALHGLAQGLARDLGPRSITINNVQPGPVDTEMNPENGGFASTLKSFTALGRYAHVNEIAGMVAYLAGPEAGFVTGASLTIDGGFNA